jgi:hypothetical protein
MDLSLTSARACTLSHKALRRCPLSWCPITFTSIEQLCYFHNILTFSSKRREGSSQLRDIRPRCVHFVKSRCRPITVSAIIF